MNTVDFPAVAERSFELSGPVERTVLARIGAPESDPRFKGSYRCPFQVKGLSDDSVQYAVGVDSFQALNLAFAGIRSCLEKNASVLSAFHNDFSLNSEAGPWQLAVPIWVNVNNMYQHQRLQEFLSTDFWKQQPENEE